MQFVMQEAKTAHESRIAPFLGELKRLSFFGTPLALPPSQTPPPVSIAPPPSTSATDPPAKKGTPYLFPARFI